MKDETVRTTEIIEVRVIDAQITRLLHRSQLSHKILFALKDKDSYISELARIINSDSSNVKMCIEGNSRRYRPSLIQFGLIFKYQVGSFCYYGLTELGHKLLRSGEVKKFDGIQNIHKTH